MSGESPTYLRCLKCGHTAPQEDFRGGKYRNGPQCPECKSIKNFVVVWSRKDGTLVGTSYQTRTQGE